MMGMNTMVAAKGNHPGCVNGFIYLWVILRGCQYLCRMLGWLMNLEGFDLMEELSRNLAGGTAENKTILSQDWRFPGRDSNRARPECQHAQFCNCKYASLYQGTNALHSVKRLRESSL
jgi:hypothetical protein